MAFHELIAMRKEGKPNLAFVRVVIHRIIRLQGTARAATTS